LDHPRSAVLVVEVSDTTLAFDRGAKAADYAAAGIDDYWVVNLVDRQIEVYRNPTSRGYAPAKIYRAKDAVAILALPGRSIAVESFLGDV
jgi:Uma2 family endonuclease